ETVFNEKLDRNDYYDISQALFIVKPTFEFNTSEVSAFSIGASYRYSDITSDDNTFMSMNRFYGFGNFSYLGFHTLSRFDSRDSDIYPYKGFYADIYGDYYPELLNNDNQFGKAGFDVRTYLTTELLSRITLALRTVGEKVWGTFPFYEAAFLGGSNSLRGFNQNRFAGDASLLGQLELRMKIARINILIPAEFGISVFGEVGRVFLNGEESKKWHNAYGGGIWMSYVARMLNLGLDVGNSKDGLVFYLTTGFSY
ncbi:MAG: BamA/TamA family outer membrane protein, partial [Bacteroidetes bacterium]|nr:BamA/TamA family outer membrane protein [Bacteroidota bacterium]